MSGEYENPMAPAGAPIQECCIEFYSDLVNPLMNQFRIDHNFVSLVHLLDKELLKTPSVSEGEIQSVGEETHESKRGEIQQIPMNNEDTRKTDVNAFIAAMKNNINIIEKVREDEKSGKKICRSTSQSSSSSTEMSPKHHKSISLDKLPIRYTSPNSNKRSRSPVRRQLVEYEPSSSSSASSTGPSSRNKSSTYNSSSSASSTGPPSRNKSSTYNSSSKQRASPKRLQYSRPLKSSIRSPSWSPTPARSSSRYKSSKCSLSKRHSSRRSSSGKQYSSSSRSYIHTPSRSPSPARSSRFYTKSSKRKSSTPERSLTPRRSAQYYGSSSYSGRSSNRPKSPSLDKRSKHRGSRKRSPVQQKKIPIEDEYAILLAKEKKRQMNDGSDFEEEPQLVIEQKAASSEEKEIPEEKEPANDTKDLSQDEQNLVEKELGIANEDLLQPGPSFLQSKNLKEEIKFNYTDKKGFLNTFYCPSCQLSLNSESTWQSHINGKKHAKVLKLQTVHEVAKGSIAIPSNPALAKEDHPRFANPATGTQHFRIRDDVPRLQPAIDNYTKSPILGLQSVREIRTEMEVHYYCELCDAPCSAHSIMPHLTGYKHQLRFLKEIDPDCYERNKSLPKKQYERRLIEILFDHEHKFGRGQIKIFEERGDPQASTSYGAYFQPGSSMGNISHCKKERGVLGAAAIPPNDECLDISKADFYCKLCDAHMNNVNMWEAHVRGKRHLTNAKKIPGENISKVRSVKAPPGTRSILEQLVRKNADNEIVVGLGFIKETQGPNGEIYNCFLCGSCCTNFDIVNHLLLTKHRIRYLEALDADGKPNSITMISQMEIGDDYFRRNLIDDECRRMLEEYGSGKVDVYISKK